MRDPCRRSGPSRSSAFAFGSRIKNRKRDGRPLARSERLLFEIVLEPRVHPPLSPARPIPTHPQVGAGRAGAAGAGPDRAGPGASPSTIDPGVLSPKCFPCHLFLPPPLASFSAASLFSSQLLPPSAPLGPLRPPSARLSAPSGSFLISVYDITAPAHHNIALKINSFEDKKGLRLGSATPKTRFALLIFS